MPIFEITSDGISKVNETTFTAQGVREREDLQRLLKKQIDVIDPDTLIIAEEFCEWEDSKRRIDLLGLDRDANLVVFELKRTEDGGHMELQAIRYAAMVSTMTFDKAVEVYADYLERNGREADARTALLQFLKWAEPDDDRFNQDVRIVLVSAEFSKELTTAMLWLNDRDMDIRCVRIKPHKLDDRLLVDVQQIIPLKEAADYQEGVRKKNQKERIARETTKDYKKFDITINGIVEERLAKRQAILRVVKHLCASSVPPERIADILSSHPRQVFQSIAGKADSTIFVEQAAAQAKKEGRLFDATRYFCAADDLIFVNGNTYAFSNQWGPPTEEAIIALLTAFPDKGVSCRASNAT